MVTFILRSRSAINPASVQIAYKTKYHYVITVCNISIAKELKSFNTYEKQTFSLLGRHSDFIKYMSFFFTLYELLLFENCSLASKNYYNFKNLDIIKISENLSV